MYGYDLLDKVPGLAPEKRYASTRPDGLVIAGERCDQLEALMPHWPVVELPHDVGPTVPIADWAATSHLTWSEQRGRWVGTPELAAAISSEAARMRATAGS